MHPRAIVEGFVIEESAAGLVLRHAQREALQLSGVAAAVWRHADGLRSVDELAELVGTEVDKVWLALDELADAELVVARVAPPAASRGLSRREVQSLAAGGQVTAGLAPVGAAAAETKGSVRQQEQEDKVGAGSVRQQEQEDKVGAGSVRKQEQEQEAKGSVRRQEQEDKVGAGKEQEAKGSVRKQEQEDKVGPAKEQGAKVEVQKQEQTQQAVKTPSGE